MKWENRGLERFLQYTESFVPVGMSLDAKSHCVVLLPRGWPFSSADNLLFFIIQTKSCLISYLKTVKGCSFNISTAGQSSLDILITSCKLQLLKQTKLLVRESIRSQRPFGLLISRFMDGKIRDRLLVVVVGSPWSRTYLFCQAGLGSTKIIVQ